MNITSSGDSGGLAGVARELMRVPAEIMPRSVEGVLGFNLATGLPPVSAAGLRQPLLGIAVLAVALKIRSLMGGGTGVATGQF